MKTVTFYGVSDDLLEIEGDIKGCDEYGAYNADDGEVNTCVRITHEHGRINVYAIYDGCWSFAPALVDEDEELPGWPIRFRAEGYSIRMEIDLPDDAVIVVLDRKGGRWDLPEGDAR